MKKSKQIKAWNNCDICNCGTNDCCLNNHRLCGICGSKITIPIEQRKILKCAYNDKNSIYGWDIDHIKPKSLGGNNDDNNLRASHIKCNVSRGNNKSPQH